MGRLPWRWALIMLMVSVAAQVVFLSIEHLVAFEALGPRTDRGLADYANWAWRSTLLGPWLLVVVLAVATFFGLGRGQSLANVRAELASRSRIVPIVTALLVFFLAAPLAIAASVLAFAPIVRGAQPLSPPGMVRVHNDQQETVRVTFCPQQDCRGQFAHRLREGEHLDFKVQAGVVPDSIVVRTGDGAARCEVVSPSDGSRSLPVRLSETDARTCGADVDSMTTE